MNDELQKQLAAWSSQQIPLLVQEKIAFGRAWETSALLLMISLGWGAWWVAQQWHRAEYDDGFDRVFIGAMLCIPLGGWGMGVFAALRGCLLVWFAPRLYIVEWLRGLVQ